MTIQTVKQAVGTRNAVTVTGLSTLASATYAVSNDVNNTTNQPVDLLVELEATPGTVAGNKQALLFAIASNDGTNYTTGPTSGSTATDEPDLFYIGTLPLNTSATQQRKMFAVAAAFGGCLPAHVKFVVRNDSGAAFTAGALYVSEISATVG